MASIHWAKAIEPSSVQFFCSAAISAFSWRRTGKWALVRRRHQLFCIQQIVLHASFWFPSPSRCTIPPEGISKRLISREVAAWKLGLLFSQQMNIFNGLMDLHSRPLVGSRRKNLWYDLRPFLWSLARSDVQGSSPRLWGVLISFAWPVRLPLCYTTTRVTYSWRQGRSRNRKTGAGATPRIPRGRFLPYVRALKLRWRKLYCAEWSQEKISEGNSSLELIGGLDPICPEPSWIFMIHRPEASHLCLSWYTLNPL